MKKYLDLYKQMWIDWKDFAGKTNLNDFWTIVVINIIVSTVVSLLGGLFNAAWISSIYALAILVPQIAIGVRRLHDVGKKGTYLLWFLVPIVGWVFVILQWIKPSVAA